MDDTELNDVIEKDKERIKDRKCYYTKSISNYCKTDNGVHSCQALKQVIRRCSDDRKSNVIFSKTEAGDNVNEKKTGNQETKEIIININPFDFFGSNSENPLDIIRRELGNDLFSNNSRHDANNRNSNSKKNGDPDVLNNRNAIDFDEDYKHNVDMMTEALNKPFSVFNFFKRGGGGGGGGSANTSRGGSADDGRPPPFGGNPGESGSC